MDGTEFVIICRNFAHDMLRSRNSLQIASCGSVFFEYGDVFFVVSRWPKSPLLASKSLFGIEILHSVVRHLDRLLPGINLCVLIWAPRHPVRWSQRRCRYRKEDRKISIPKKRHLDTN